MSGWKRMAVLDAGDAAARSSSATVAASVVPLAALDHYSLAIAGGKGANLGEMLRAGLPVPDGFCVTTAAYEVAAAAAGLGPLVDGIAAVPPAETARLETLAAQARERLAAVQIPDDLAAAVVDAYRRLAEGHGEGVHVAVRSSATAEDLPSASFAGQQDTFLNVVGEPALLDAVRRCWASLWTDRAVAYRASNGVDQRTVKLAVVVQRMVDAAVAGVLFTANPLTGRRHEAVIDANPGLGEAVVSGATNPDRFVVRTASGEIVERRVGDKRVRVVARAAGGTERVEDTTSAAAPCLTDAQVRALADLGARLEAHYGAPQDVEWALDTSGTFWLTQTRPITTLFPLPADAPSGESTPRVYFSISVAQGVNQPMTPMGLQAFRLFASSARAALGLPVTDPASGSGLVTDAGFRAFADVTPLLRSDVGRRVAATMFGVAEARSGGIWSTLIEDPRWPLGREPAGRGWRPVIRALLPALLRHRVPLRIVHGLIDPASARRNLRQTAERNLAEVQVPEDASPLQRIAAAERLLLLSGPFILDAVVPTFAPGMLALALASRLLRHLASAEEWDTVRRALPYNPTTEMDLALWDVAARLRHDAAAAEALRERPPEHLAGEYLAGRLPPTLQRGLAEFLSAYGHRGVAEIDLGVPRWRDNPAHILGALSNYLRLEDPDQAPDVQFRRGERAAVAMVRKLTRRAVRRNPLYGLLVWLALNRARQLAGQREAPKFFLVEKLAAARRLLYPAGEALASQGKLDAPDDIYFLSFPEAKATVSGADVHVLVRERREAFEREKRRRVLPRFLLSDGTIPEATREPSGDADHVLRGTAASAGQVTGTARVILDPNGAHLEPGEILVAPSTDPGWTPLFLTAGGLVMEMGGAMSHGAVVAREYGIPAVVGVPGATERIVTGQRIRVDGAAGVVALNLD